MTDNKNRFWTVDGSIDFAQAPGLLDFEPSPIRLLDGNNDFGAVHIQCRHPDVASKLKVPNVAAAVWLKLQQSGTVYCCETDTKAKIVLPMGPDMLLVMQYVRSGREGPFWSVSTMYQNRTRVDGEQIGRFRGTGRTITDAGPAFDLQSSNQPMITIKKKRPLVRPDTD